MIHDILDISTNFLKIGEKQQLKLMAPFDIETLTTDMICHIFFGILPSQYTINGKNAIKEARELFNEIRKFTSSKGRLWFGDAPFMCTRKYRETLGRIKKFRQFFEEKIHQRMKIIDEEAVKNLPRKNLLHIIAEERKKYGNDSGKTFSNDELIDEFVIFFIAGKDTTSILISMALYELTRNLEWLQKLAKEADELFSNREITTELVNSKENLTAFLKETLRYYPPAPTVLIRYAKTDIKLRDLQVKKDTPIVSAFIANHFNEKYFNNPLEFNPSRWLESNKTDEGWKKEPFAYLPFSSGMRNCIGQHLAMLEARVTIALIVKHYSISIESGYKLDMSLGEGFILQLPEKPIPFILTPKD